jgi:mercuric ion transport protein
MPGMKDSTKATAPSVGAVVAAGASALCCAGPVLAVAAGVSGAGLASTFEPLRPYLLAATAGLLLWGFWLLDREERRACEPGKVCASPAVRRRMKLMLWAATLLSVVLVTYPSWQQLLF